MKSFHILIAGVAFSVLASHALGVTIYVPSVNPQLIPTLGGPTGLERGLNTQSMLQGTLFSEWQHYETRGPGVVTAGAGPATDGTPQMLQNNAFLVSTPPLTGLQTSTKVTFGVPILKDPDAVMTDVTGGATGIDFYNPALYFTYADILAGHLTLSFSYNVPSAGGPMAIAIGFESSRYPSPGTGTEIKFEPAYNSTFIDQSTGANGPLYDNRDQWITTQNILGPTLIWNIGGTNTGTLSSAPMVANFGGTYIRNLLIGMGSGVPGRTSWIDNVTLAYDGATGGVPFSITYDFGDVEPGIPVPEPSSLMLLGLGLAGMSVRARRRHRSAA